MTALILEDDSDCAQLLSRIVSEEGYTSVVCARAADAINAFDAHKPELLLLDIGLQGAQDGYYALRRLRARHEALKDGVPRIFLMVSARDNYGDIEAAVDFGADGYITKPFTKTEVQLKIREIKMRRD